MAASATPRTRKTPAATSDALKADVAAVKETPFGTVTFDDVEYGIVKSPPTLLLSELARVGTGDPEAMSVFAEFFEVTLGDNYVAFKRAVYRSENGDEEALFKVLQEILEKTLGRPTE